MSITKITKDEDFQPFISSSPGKIFVIDFYADWCGPCKNISPYFEQLANTFADQAIFGKVDIDSCSNVATLFRVSGIPYFVIFKDGKEVDNLRGANKDGLKSMIEKNLSSSKNVNSSNSAQSSSSNLIPSQPQNVKIFGIPKAFDLTSKIDKKMSECLNEDTSHPWTNILENNDACLKSDCDEQLLIRITFIDSVKLYGIKIVGSAIENAPDKIRILINQVVPLDFDTAENASTSGNKSSAFDFDLSKDSLSETTDAINLPKLKFSQVNNITIFLPSNFNEDEVTILKRLVLIGQTNQAKTNMDEFKRVQGQVGEGE